jgi:hypothetical protein
MPLDNTVAGPAWVWLFGLFVLFSYGVQGGGWLGVEDKGSLFPCHFEGGYLLTAVVERMFGIGLFAVLEESLLVFQFLAATPKTQLVSRSNT